MSTMIYCRGCGKQIHESALSCPHCGAPQTAASNNDSSEVLKFIVPIGRSGWAIAAGYLAFFAIFVIPAPFALFCGIMALRDIKRNPTKLGLPRAWFGIVMGIIGLLVWWRGCTISNY